jgi:hypothetical protein
MAMLAACGGVDAEPSAHDHVTCTTPARTAEQCERACVEGVAPIVPRDSCMIQVGGAPYACGYLAVREWEGVVGCCGFNFDRTMPALRQVFYECEGQ